MCRNAVEANLASWPTQSTQAEPKIKPLLRIISHIVLSPGDSARKQISHAL